MDIENIIAVSDALTPYVLLLIAVVAYTKGWIVPKNVVKSIVSETVKAVLSNMKEENEAVMAGFSARVIAAIDDLLNKHEENIKREFDRKGRSFL